MGRFQKEEAARLYAKQMGAEAAERQKREAIKAKGGCVCQVRQIKKRWDGDTLTIRSIHETDCIKFKWWMKDDQWAGVE